MDAHKQNSSRILVILWSQTVATYCVNTRQKKLHCKNPNYQQLPQENGCKAVTTVGLDGLNGLLEC